MAVAARALAKVPAPAWPTGKVAHRALLALAVAAREALLALPDRAVVSP